MARLCYISRGRCSAECNVALTKDEAAGPPARSHTAKACSACRIANQQGAVTRIFESGLKTLIAIVSLIISGRRVYATYGPWIGGVAGGAAGSPYSY